MKTTRISDRRLVGLAWGVFFIWWGLVDADFGVLSSLPRGIGWIGVGAILLGLNAARWRIGLPVSVFSVPLGLLAAGLGVLKLARLWPSPTIDVSFLAALLIVVGLGILSRHTERRPTAA